MDTRWNKRAAESEKMSIPVKDGHDTERTPSRKQEYEHTCKRFMNRNLWKILNKSIYSYCYLRPPAQHCFAADAAGAAPDLGAILGRGGAPSLVPVGGGRQRRRWKQALGIRPHCEAIHVDRWRDACLRGNTKKRWTKGERSTHQEAERTT